MFSIVIPLYNEAKNIEILLTEIYVSLKKYKNFEIILVNDFSSDNTLEVIKNIQKKNHITLVNNSKNQGQSYAIHKGITISKNNLIVTIDGDGQNNPKDKPRLLELFFANKDVSLVGGIRFKRKDSNIKILSSKIANAIRSKILNDDCLDTGCSLKVFEKNIFLNFPYFNGIHRFLPALFKGYGYKTLFINVDHRHRKEGKSNYGTIDRLYRGIIDIIKVRKIIKKNISK